VLVFLLIAGVVWATAYVVRPAPQRHLVLATGLADGLAHRYGQRYIEILGRSGVKVEERLTNGAGENLKLLQDANSGVDIAFTQGGIAKTAESDRVVMLASLFYVPMWIFYRGAEHVDQINELRYRRVTVGVDGGGTREFAEPLLELNGLSTGIVMVPASNMAALRALEAKDVDAAIFVDGAQNEAVRSALYDRSLRLMTFRARGCLRAAPRLRHEADASRGSDRLRAEHSRARGHADRNQGHARGARRPASRARQPAARCRRRDSRRQGYFERAGEFPGTDAVDLPVSVEAAQHKKFGAEPASPLSAVLGRHGGGARDHHRRSAGGAAVSAVPLPAAIPALARSLAHLPVVRRARVAGTGRRDARRRAAHRKMDGGSRSHRTVRRGNPHTAGFASEAYTLREHIGLVRRAVQARMAAPAVN
jgi:hypothetical protein